MSSSTEPASTLWQRSGSGDQLTLERRRDYRRFEREATFCLTKGLADPSGVSFEALSVPNYFIRYRDSALWLDRRGGSDLFKMDATFESAHRPIEMPVRGF